MSPSNGKAKVKKNGTLNPCKEDTWNNWVLKNQHQSRYPVMIGTPTTGLVRIEWCQGRYHQTVPCNWSLKQVQWPIPGWAPLGYLVADAQNIIVSRFMAENCQWLLLLEQDNVLPLDAFVRFGEYMRSEEIPVVSALYFSKSVPSEPLVYRGRGNSYYADWKIGDLVWVDAVPTGVCFPAGELVNTGWDWKPIENCQAGESVLTHAGQSKTVRATHQRPYVGPMVRLRTRMFGYPIDLTPEHPVLAVKARYQQKGGVLRKPVSPCRPYFGYKPEWIPAGDLTDEHIVLYRFNNQIRHTEHVTLSEHVTDCVVADNNLIGAKSRNDWTNYVKNHVEVSPSLLRLIGYYLAEGDVSQTHVRFSFAEKEIEYVNDVRTIAAEVFGLEAGALEYYRNGVRIVLSSRILADWFTFQFGTGSHSKRIPKWAMLLKPSLQANLLKGYFRGDGCYLLAKWPRRISCSSASRAMMLQVRDLLLRQGVIPSSSSHVRKTGYKPGTVKHALTVQGDGASRLLATIEPDLAFTRASCKLQGHRGWIWDDFAWLPIRKVERYDYDGPVYNLDVDGDQSYSVSGMTVHNCLIHRSIIEVLWHDSPEYRAGDVVTRQVFQSPQSFREIAAQDGRKGIDVSTGTSDMEFCSRIIGARVFERAGWKEFQKKPFPFAVDTSILSMHIREDGMMFPSQPELDYWRLDPRERKKKHPVSKRRQPVTEYAGR